MNFLQNLEDSADTEHDMCVKDESPASCWTESRYLLTFSSEELEGGLQSSMCCPLSLQSFRTAALRGIPPEVLILGVFRVTIYSVPFARGHF